MDARPIRNFFANPFVAGLLVSGCVFAMCADDAMAQRRGGGGGMSRGGGGGGASRGSAGARAGNHGGRTAQSSVSGGNRSGRGGDSRGGDRGGGDRSGSVERNGGDRTRTSGDRTNNIGSNNNINIEGRDVNIDVEGGWGGGCCWGGVRHPIAAGVTIGAIAGMTAAAVGSYYYALPPSGCSVVVMNGVSYHQCGGAYYSEALDGDEVVYVSVNP
jgi:hypothetical protein